MKLIKLEKLIKLTFTDGISVLFSDKVTANHTGLTGSITNNYNSTAPLVKIPTFKINKPSILPNKSFVTSYRHPDNPALNYFFAKTCWGIENLQPLTGFNSICTAECSGSKYLKHTCSSSVDTVEYLKSTIGIPEVYLSTHSTTGGFERKLQTLLKVEEIL